MLRRAGRRRVSGRREFVVEAFDEAERGLVFRSAVGGDTVPVAIDHIGEALAGSKAALPFEACSPVVEEAPAQPSRPSSQSWPTASLRT